MLDYQHVKDVTKKKSQYKLMDSLPQTERTS